MTTAASALIQGARAFVDQRLAYALGAAPRTMPLLYVEVIKACNLRCTMCAYPTHYPTRGGLLTTEELVGMMRESLELDTRIVSFGGGEPFLRKDIFTLIEAAGSLGLGLHINTNGTRFDDAAVSRLAGATGLALVFSLDHPDPARNDAIRGEGVFAQVEAAVAMLRARAPSIHLGINCVVGRHTRGDLGRMVDLAARWGVASLKFLPLHANLGHRYGDGAVVRGMQSSASDAAAFGDELLAAAARARALGLATSSVAFLKGIPAYLQGTLRFPCWAGFVYGNVDPYGFLFPCYDHAEPLDVRTIGLAAAWRSEAMQRMRDRVRRCENPCWNSGNAEPSIRMNLGELTSDPAQLLADLELILLS